jgi:hypothetical protein
MRNRRYREKNPNLFVASGHKNHRIHDFLKGWGTVDKDGSILWDSWRPPTKKEIARAKRNSDKAMKKLKEGKLTFLLPQIVNRCFPTLSVQDIIGVQPMSNNQNESEEIKNEV